MRIEIDDQRIKTIEIFGDLEPCDIFCHAGEFYIKTTVSADIAIHLITGNQTFFDVSNPVEKVTGILQIRRNNLC